MKTKTTFIGLLILSALVCIGGKAEAYTPGFICPLGQFVSAIDGQGNVTCSTAGGVSTTTINSVPGPTFTFTIVNTSTASTITTTTAQLFLNLLAYSSGTNISVGTNGVINFLNPGFITSASATIFSALQTFNVGATVNGTTTLASTTNALLLANGSGTVSGYAGSGACAANSFATAVSATGTVTCAPAPGSAATTTINGTQSPTFNINGTGNVTTTLGGASTTFSLTGIIPSSNGGTATTTALGSNAFNSTTIYGAGTYLGVSGSNLTASSTLASSSVAFEFYNATSTAPAFQDIQTTNQKNITAVSCSEFSPATTSVELYYNTTLASSGIQQVILSSIACGINGTSTTTFTTSTLPINAYLFAAVSSTAGTPTLTTVNVQATKL